MTEAKKIAEAAEAAAGSAEAQEASQQRQEASVKRQEKSQVRQEDSADRRTELAMDRTVMAGERTYAAWMRTGLAAMASSVGAAKLLEGVRPSWLSGVASFALAFFAAFAFVAAVWRELDRSRKPPRPDIHRLPGWVMVGFSAVMALVSMGVVAGMLAR